MPNEQCRDKALEHRRWLEFGLGTNAKRFAPIRQGEGVSRTISGDSKGQRVLWRVFLCYLSSREERWHPRRAFPVVERKSGSGAVGFCAAFPTALHQSLRCPCGHHLPKGVPAEAQRSGFGGERRRKEVNGAFRPKGGNGVHGLFDDAGGFGAVVLHNCKERLRMHCKGARIAVPQGHVLWAHQ